MHDEEYQELLYDAVLGELSDEKRARLEAAMRASPELRQEHDALMAMWQQLGDVLAAPGPAHPPLLPVRRRQSRWVASAASLAAAVLCFVAGYWWAQRSAVATTPEDGRFAILLYAGGGGGGQAANTDFVARVVQEHRDWATQLQEQNQHILSEKLSPTVGVDLYAVEGEVERHAESSDLHGRRLGGVYIVTAASLDAAADIARGCPLLNYGGVVRVRAIEPTQTNGGS